MITETSGAWLLHKRPSGDSSCHVRLYTQDLGLVDALYKGGRSPKKQSVLQPFVRLWVAIDRRRDWYYVRQLESESSPLLLQGHSLFAALYVNEIMNALLKTLDSDSTLYVNYINTLHALAEQPLSAIEPILRRFELNLLAALGYGVQFGNEALSGSPIVASGTYQWMAASGFVSATKGFSGAHLLAIASNQLDTPDVLRTAKQILRQAIAQVLDGKAIQSRRLFANPRWTLELD